MSAAYSQSAERAEVRTEALYFFFLQNQFLLTFLFKVDVAGGIFEQASPKRDTFMNPCVMGRLVVIVDLLFF